jgi:hypothetical protein
MILDRALLRRVDSVAVSDSVILVEQLDSQAKRTGVSRSELVRQHLKQAMGSEAGRPTHGTEAAPPHSKLDQLELFRAAWSRIRGKRRPYRISAGMGHPGFLGWLPGLAC